MDFDHSLWRFGTSGTLLSLYGVAEWLSRRHGASPDRPGIRPPRLLQAASILALTAFYLLIGPAGGALAGGWGNAFGIALALAAMILRYAVRRGVPGIGHPTVATRLLFYTALPIAVGVPWGLVALTLPAWLIAAACTLREERILAEQYGEPERHRPDRTWRFVPGVW